ncbi:MAG: pyrimidine 5'-nucleotidase [SAR116 cluster bacterium]|nr:pyrimidine 5'-nucleotidase [SAR116 cluster bacterium]RPH09917.1 MAG: pyrimidine 5'-nucleotidase [Alphaproteobacteria bacterium TMED54]|tara:strand:- start:3174 stop:3863 length:690 start_codon:yes stop_codon:yes gene_type:complete
MIYENNFKYWIFDLDNTIYDIKLGLFKKISERITNFIVSKYSLDIDEAKKIQKKYYLEYGLTLRGLILEKNLNPEEFLDYVHDVEHPELKKDKYLKSKIEKLQGKKIIFTNATSKHAEKILTILEIRELFDQIIDIKDLDYIPKPDKRSYQKLLECLNVDKEQLKKGIFLEDTVKNLIPAKELGMTTVWIKNSTNKNDFTKNFKSIDYSFNNINEFLDQIKMRGKNGSR